MFNFLFKATLLTCLIKLALFCEPPNCDRQDCGTCGNSCCTLDFFTRLDPNSLSVKMASILQSGGPDQHYTFVATEDLRPYNISAYFILQGIHTTFVKKYNDTLNFVIYPVNSSTYFQSRMRAFSISQIHGAYCDDGQNYKNLILLMQGSEFIENTISGCPPKI